jgi:hypothetical protein
MNEKQTEGPQDPEYQEIQGDLFLCPEEAALAHCVSQGMKILLIQFWVILESRYEDGKRDRSGL